MKNKSILFKLQYCEAIFDYGVNGVPGIDPESFAQESVNFPVSSSPHLQANLRGEDIVSYCLNREEVSKDSASSENGDKEQEPSVRISLGGRKVYKAPLDGHLCIPAEVVEQLVNQLLAYRECRYPHISVDNAERTSSIEILVQRDNEKRQVHILFPLTKRAPYAHHLDCLRSSSDKTHEQTGMHTAILIDPQDNEER